MKPIAILQECFSAPWLIERHALASWLSVVAVAEYPDDDEAADDDGLEYAVADEIAHIELSGAMVKRPSILTRYFGCVATQNVVAALQKAAADPSVKGVMLRIDSPGGQAMGTGELANAIRNVGKPTMGYIDGMGCSAAYWAASACDMIYAAADSLVGSIGTVAVVNDLSEMFAKIGLKVNVVSSGGMKGAGTPGTKVTQEQLDDTQRLVNDYNAQFLSGVAAGRKNLTFEQILSLADGRVHVGARAQGIGLVDAVGTAKDAENALRAKINRPVGASMMATPPVATRPAVQSEVSGEVAIANALQRFQVWVDDIAANRKSSRPQAVQIIARDNPGMLRDAIQCVNQEAAPTKEAARPTPKAGKSAESDSEKFQAIIVKMERAGLLHSVAAERARRMYPELAKRAARETVGGLAARTTL